MIDYHNIWESLNCESKSSPLKPQIARRIPTNGIFNVFLATDIRKGIRILYVNLESNHEIITEKLPRFKGLEITITSTSLGEFNNVDFLKFTQSIPSSDNIFELVISDFCDKIIQLKSKSDLSSALIKVLNEWKIFFEKQENEILSIAYQKGLVGELHFLENYLFSKYSFSESIYYWTGSDKTNHDFQMLNNAIEIKTTSSKQHKKFIVSSERQLDSTGLDHLYLSLITLNIHSNMPQRSLPALILSIYSKIHGDPIAAFQFRIKLAKYGYNENYANKYMAGFSIVDMKFYEVVEGFPRLLQEHLPNGVGDLKYSVAVGACSHFEIKTEIINYI